jgi:hypothetical protein
MIPASVYTELLDEPHEAAVDESVRGVLERTAVRGDGGDPPSAETDAADGSDVDAFYAEQATSLPREASDQPAAAGTATLQPTIPTRTSRSWRLGWNFAPRRRFVTRARARAMPTGSAAATSPGDGCR